MGSNKQNNPGSCKNMWNMQLLTHLMFPHYTINTLTDIYQTIAKDFLQKHCFHFT